MKVISLNEKFEYQTIIGIYIIGISNHVSENERR